MNSEGFIADIWTSELFFRFCARYHVESKEDRTRLMRELARRKKATYIRDVAPLMVGKKVLKIGFGHGEAQ